MAVGGGDLGAERLPEPGAEHPELEGAEQRPGLHRPVEEVGPHGGVAAVEHPHGVVGQEPLRDGGHQRRVDPAGPVAGPVAQRRVELGPVGVPCRADAFQPGAAGGGVRRRTSRLQRLAQRVDGRADVGPQRVRQRPVGAEHGRVEVDLDGRGGVGAGPVGGLAPPVGLAEPGAEHHDRVGLVADLVDEVHVDHRHRVRAGLRDGPAGRPAGGRRRVQQLGELADAVLGAGVQHPGPDVQQRPFGAVQQRGDLGDLPGVGWHGHDAAVAGWRADLALVVLVAAVEQVLGDVEVDDPGPALVHGPQRVAEQLADPVAGGHVRGPLGHRGGDGGLVEVLVGPAPVGTADPDPPGGGQQQHPVALALLDGDAGQHVGDAGAVAGHAHPEPAGAARVGAGHVRCGRLVPGRVQLDAGVGERRVQPVVGAVDDAEDGVDPFGGQHAGDDRAP